MLPLLCAIALAPANAAQFFEPFDGPDNWVLRAGPPAKVAISGGALTLDMSAAKRGKWALAELRRAFDLPAAIQWDQCLAHDSRYTWYCGILVYSRSFPRTERVWAGLGGSGMGRRFFLGEQKSDPGAVRPGVWYTLRLEVSRTRQTLEVREREGGRAVAVLQDRRGIGHMPCSLRFFQNDPRLGPELPDDYDQDRGTTVVDNLRLEAPKIERAEPPQPGTAYPYKVPVVFNRASRWITAADGLSGGCIVYEACGEMMLTGRRAVSEWLEIKRRVLRDPTRLPGDSNIRALEGETEFTAQPGEGAATFALRALQFNINQHPIMAYQLSGQAELEVTVTDGVHPFRISLWRSAGKSQGRVDLRELYRASGRPNRYAELDFVIRLPRDAQRPRQVRLRLWLLPRRCIILRGPIVASRETAARGVPIEAVLVGADGRLVASARISAAVSGPGGQREIWLLPVRGGPVYRGIARGLPPGRYTVRAWEVGGPAAADQIELEVAGPDFLDHYDPAARSYASPSGVAAGPLLGDLLAWVPYAKLGTKSQRLILGYAEARRLAASGQRVDCTKWRSMPRRDIDRYVAYMAESGCRVLRLTPNVSPAEYYMDAGGRLAMHGLEQLCYVLSAARRNGMRVIINLFHYPYLSPATGMNPPVLRYFEAGYRRRFNWTSDEMWRLLSAYLDQLLGFIGDDPAVLGYTVMGENGQRLPVSWMNRALSFIKSRASRHMVMLEQGGNFLHCAGGDPRSYRRAGFKAATDGGVGYRTYNTYTQPTDLFIAAAARFYNIARPSYLGEVACGVNVRPQFQVKLRDAMGMAAVLQQPMAISWSAPLIEAQRRAFTEAARLIDWSRFRRARAHVAVIVGKPDHALIARLVEIERALQRLGLDADYFMPDQQPRGYPAIIDARRPVGSLDFGRGLPEALAALRPIAVSEGNHVAYAASSDGRWLLAYIRNAGRYEKLNCDVGRIVELCRMPAPARRLRVRLQGFAAGLQWRAFRVDPFAPAGRGLFSGTADIDLGDTPADYVFVVTPAGQGDKR